MSVGAILKQTAEAVCRVLEQCNRQIREFKLTAYTAMLGGS